MLSLLRRPKSRNNTRDNPDYTKNIARDRLQTAIARDRYDLVASDIMESLRRDLLTAISRHLEVGGDFQELEIRRLNQSLYLVASIPIRGVPRWAAVN